MLPLHQAHIQRFERFSKEPEEDDDDFDGPKEIPLDAGKFGQLNNWLLLCSPGPLRCRQALVSRADKR